MLNIIRPQRPYIWISMVIGGLLLGLNIQAETQTLSPYFFVKSKESSEEDFPLKHTSTEVHISGVIADVVITQTYANMGNSPIEATYVFPGSANAAVYGMTMTIGDRRIKAQIKEKQAARRTYETAKAQGKSASLLQQQRPNVFQMDVANILPEDRIQVELRYTELLTPKDKIYSFVYPTVVGPRYSDQPSLGAPESEKWVSNPYLKSNQDNPSTFELKVRLDAGMPLQSVSSGTHKIDVEYEGKYTADITIDNEEFAPQTRDFVLNYQLAGKSIESGLLLFEGEDENFFLYTAQPPKRHKASYIPPREYIFIIDVSGSMNGFPMQVSKDLIRRLVGKLRPTDTFNMLFFAGGSALLSERSLAATESNVWKALQQLDSYPGGGGTALLPALRRALELEESKGRSRTFVVITDGYVHVEAETFDLIKENLNRANLFSFGIGSSVNRYIIDGMARIGRGEPFVVTNVREASSKVKEFADYIAAPLLTDVKIEFAGFDVYDLNIAKQPDLLADRPIVAFGKWKGKAQGNIRLSGITGAGLYQHDTLVSRYHASDSSSGLAQLWARNRIKELSDYNKLQSDDSRISEVTRLGLLYNLLTQYTSFVAVDEVIRNPGADSKKIKQPLPLPKNVSEMAVGGSFGSTPEPSSIMLLGIVALMLCGALWIDRQP
ncbi:MAG: VIT and VWA domain-containing protein [Verrucomicrobiota bacterium]